MKTQGAQGTTGTGQVKAADRAGGESRLPGGFFGEGSSVATKALGVKKALTARAHQLGVKLGLVNHQNAMVRKVIDSIGINKQ